MVDTFILYLLYYYVKQGGIILLVLRNQVLSVLSFSIWQSLWEIRTELHQLRGIPEKSWFKKMNLGEIAIVLDLLEAEGLISIQERDDKNFTDEDRNLHSFPGSALVTYE